MPTALPGSLATRRHENKSDIQRAFYSGYLCRHRLKAQVVYLSSGVIGLVFITELWQNDSGLLNMSRLNDYLVGLLSGNLVGQLLPCLYCNGICANLATILRRYTNPTPEERLLNLKLASQRQYALSMCLGITGIDLNCFQFHTTFVYSTKVLRYKGNV
jgi:hypothetical protein